MRDDAVPSEFPVDASDSDDRVGEVPQRRRADTIASMDWVAGALADYVDRWGIVQDGDAITTPSSWLVRGRWGERNVMLKVARVAEEARGGRVLAWWAGRAAAAVHEVNDQAVLMDLASERRSLSAMSQTGRDDESTQALCETIASLHSAGDRSSAPADLVPLPVWFHALSDPRRTGPHTREFRRATTMARELVTESSESTHMVLHGDIHHSNVLDFGGHWRAIDPKGLVGHRAFDYANIFCNPSTDIALANFHRRLAIVGEHSRLDIDTIRAWVIAWCALSVAWSGQHKSKRWAAHAILSEFN